MANEYFNFLTSQISERTNFQDYVFIFFRDICMTCPSGRIIEKIDRLQAEMPNVKFYILLPNSFTQNDIDNLKFNNSLTLDFINIGSSFQRYINEEESDGKTPPALNGLVIVTDSHGNISFVDVLLDQRKKSTKTKFLRFLDNLKRKSDS